MLGLKLIHVCERGPLVQNIIATTFNIDAFYLTSNNVCPNIAARNVVYHGPLQEPYYKKKTINLLFARKQICLERYFGIEWYYGMIWFKYKSIFEITKDTLYPDSSTPIPKTSLCCWENAQNSNTHPIGLGSVIIFFDIIKTN